MKTIFEHVEYLNEKPHHIRKRVAFAATVAGTALIGLIWVAGSVTTGAFAIQGSTFADSGRPAADVAGSEASPSSSGLAGVASAISNPDAPAHIEIVDTSPATSSGKKAEQTILPF